MSELAIPNPSATELDVIMRQAEALARSSIVPTDYRGKPANIIAAALMGRSFGWDATTSMRMITVISGTAGLKPEAMLALIRQRGHHVTIEPHPLGNGCTVHGKRADNGDSASASFTVADAERAGLTRSSAWKSYPLDMCQWRAVARLARGLFGDVVLGAGYTAEELGGEVTPPAPAAYVEPDPAPDVEPDDVIEAELVDVDPSDGLAIASAIDEVIDSTADLASLRDLWTRAVDAGVLPLVEQRLRDRAAEIEDALSGLQEVTA